MNWHKTWLPLACGVFASGVLVGRLTVAPPVLAQSTAPAEGTVRKGRVTGIGGVFFMCAHPDSLRTWYHDHLGLVTNEYGSLFEFALTGEPGSHAYLQWSPFSNKTKYFQPSTKPYMINYRVDDLATLLEQLKKDSVQVVGELESVSYGKFAHIMDPDGNKIELWEPTDSTFTTDYNGQTTH